jgi:hypothetical protein
VSRGNSAVSNAVKGLEPRAPEHEIPRLFGAGVGASFLHARALREAAATLSGALRTLERAAGELEWAVELLADEEVHAAELHIRNAHAKLAEVIDALHIELQGGGG